MNKYVKVGLGLGAVYLVYRYYTMHKVALQSVKNSDARAINFVGGIVRPPPVSHTTSAVENAYADRSAPTRESDEPSQVAFGIPAWMEVN